VSQPRPIAAILAVVLLEIIALGSIGFGVLVIALGAEVALAAASIATTVLGIAALAYGIVAIVGGVGVWRGRAWGWAAALGVAIVGLLAIVTSALSGAFQPQLLVGIALFGGLVACLLVPAVRARSGVG
jgi:uncharacterized membrane protein HdeD (DUF308 family)